MEVVLILMYLGSISTVALSLICREQWRENTDLRQSLTGAEERAVRAEGELDGLNVLEGRPYEMIMPYREGLHARIAVLERDNAKLLKSKSEIRRLTEMS